MLRKAIFVIGWMAFASSAVLVTADETPAAAAPSAAEQAARQVAVDFSQGLNDGKAEAVAELFYEAADLTDDAGNAHQGRAAISALVGKFISKFPGAKTSMQVESVWMVGPALAIEEGRRVVTTKDGQNSFASHFTFVLMKTGERWKIASAKDEEDEEGGLTPHEHLAPLAWMIGDWVDEGAEAAVKMSCRWSDDTNYLLVDFNGKTRGRTALTSSQRIGWDPLTKKVKSWVFDSDGGHGEGSWTQIESRWLVKSTAVLPDGRTGSASIQLEVKDKDHFVMKGFDRVHGDTALPDFETTIVRKPPEPGK